MHWIINLYKKHLSSEIYYFFFFFFFLQALNQFLTKSIFTNPMWIIVLLDCDKFPTRWTLVETFICILALACYKVSLSGIEKGHFISSRTKRERFSEVDPARSKEIRSEVVIEVNQSGPALRRSRSLLKVSR